MGAARRASALVICLLLGACVGAQVKPATAPSQHRLDDTEAMLSKAEQAGAAQFAPDALAAARRRLTVARSLMFDAAEQHRDLTARERKQVGRLADEAYLDARLALARTQAGAVDHKTAELRSALDQRSPDDRGAQTNDEAQP